MVARNDDPGLTQRVVKLWNAGLSGTEIMEQVGLRTRNSVMGRVNRAQMQGLATRRGTHKHSHSVVAATKAKRAHRRRPPAVVRLAPVVLADDMAGSNRDPTGEAQLLPVPTENLALALPSGRVIRWHADNGCAFLLGDDAADPLWCNAQTADGRPYCAVHVRMVNSVARALER